MKIIRYISYIFMAAAAASCSLEALPPGYDIAPPVFVGGTVYDTDNNEIEHIKITVDWGKGLEPSVNYSASDGGFAIEVPKNMLNDTFEFKITLEDTDGEDNGGQFETITDKVIYNSGEDSPASSLVYRLNRATASESSPQS